jgi:hypothetical protein
MLDVPLSMGNGQLGNWQLDNRQWAIGNQQSKGTSQFGTSLF